MANVAYIQNKIYYGYGKAAIRLGLTFNVYHSISPLNPIALPNLLGTIQSSFNQNWAYDKANKYGNNVWQMVADGRAAPDAIGFVVGDYLTGFDQDGNDLYYFVIGKQSLMPILAVSCNAFVQIERATQDLSPGFNGGYSGYLPGTSTVLATNLPVSILNSNIGRDNQMKMPTDTLLPRWVMLMPNLGGVIFKNRDIVIDGKGTRYVLASAELTDLGWRCGLDTLGA